MESKGYVFSRFSDSIGTERAVERIYEIDTTLEDEIPEKEYLELLDSVHFFRDGINKRIVQLGYSDDLADITERKKFLIEQYKTNGVKAPSDPTIRGWLSGAKTPASSSTGREDVFRLCFALEMNEKETAEFFLKAYLNRPFNYKKTNEAVYIHCLSSGKKYNDALRIIQEVKNAQSTLSMYGVSTTSCDYRDVGTEPLGQKIVAIEDEANLINFLAEHHYAENEMHLTASETIEALLHSCYDLAKKETAYTKEKTKEVNTEDALLDVIYDYDAYSMDMTIRDSNAPKFLKANWLDRQSFHNIRLREKISDDVYRKAIVLLTFYKFYASAYIAQRNKCEESDIDLRQYADQFEFQLEANLNKCGFIQIYKRSPFDWLILSCANYPNPLNHFRNLIANFFLDDVYKSEDEKITFTESRE